MLKFALLGMVQGLTEFLPVSSSGHLVLAQNWLHTGSEYAIPIDIFLHAGTLLALLFFFSKDIIRAFKSPDMLKNILLATGVTGAIGLGFRHYFELFFQSPTAVSCFLILNGLLLLSTKHASEKKERPTPQDSLWTGLAQGLALAPGLSRSGLTITMLLKRGIRREEAFRFSFLAAIPAISGALLLEVGKAEMVNLEEIKLKILVGVLTAFLFGLFALSLLNKAVKSKKLHLIGYYCICLGICAFFFFTGTHP